jgi:metal-responsive CopG/Arc/MetJ family transcriptional regulator
MISIPDDLLARLDAWARLSRETRSGLLQRLVERELEASREREHEEIESLLGRIAALGPGKSSDVDAAQLIREDRESH